MNFLVHPTFPQCLKNLLTHYVIDYFHQYITIKGGKSPETFVVATDGSYAMYWYCPTGSCRAGGDNVKIRQCEIKAGTACKTFARGKTIKWKNFVSTGYHWNEINFLEKYLANFANDIEYKRISRKLKEYDLIADVDEQRFHHFCS